MLLIIMSFLLNQSKIIMGVNLSYADFIFVLLFSIMFVSGEIIWCKKIIAFFLILTIVVIFNAFIKIPYMYNISINSSKIIINYLKLVMVLLYLILGYSLKNKIKFLLKYYSYGALIVGLLGLLSLLTGLYKELFFFGRFRLKGLMNDPNYFAVIQVSSLPYFIENKDIGKINKLLFVSIIVLSILASGSKTGMVTLIFYIIYLILQKIKYKKVKIRKKFIIKFFVSIIFIVFILIFLHSDVKNIFFDKLVYYIPSFERIKIMFENLNKGLSEGGSGRDDAWKMALNLIGRHPLTGIGVGVYSDLGFYLFNDITIAHNTYLQLSVEWGLILTISFFIYIFFSLFKIPKRDESKMIKEILICFFIGSLAISLNNARMFWIFLGLHLYSIRKVLPLQRK